MPGSTHATCSLAGTHSVKEPSHKQGYRASLMIQDILGFLTYLGQFWTKTEDAESEHGNHNKKEGRSWVCHGMGEVPVGTVRGLG